MSKTNDTVETIAARTGTFYAKGERKTITYAIYAFSAPELHRFVSRLDRQTGGSRGAAVATLDRLGYTYHGGALWKPPIGCAPDFSVVDYKSMLTHLLDRMGINGTESESEAVALLHWLGCSVESIADMRALMVHSPPVAPA